MSAKAGKLLKDMENVGLPYYSSRSGDEQDFVDRRVVMGILLPWLGWEDRDYEYNRMNAGSKPDFLVRAGTIVAFFIEDKATAESLAGHESQILEYLKKFSRKGIVCNGFRLWVVELQGNTFKISYEIDFKKAKTGLFAEEEKSEIERLYREFSKERFINLESRINSLAVPEKEFLKRAVDVDGREEVFMDEAYSIIEEVYLDVYGKLRNALGRFDERRALTEEGEREVRRALDRFLGANPSLTEKREKILERIGERCLKALRKLGYLTPEEIAEIGKAGSKLKDMERKRLRELIEIIKIYNSRLQGFQVVYSDELSLAESFFLWLEGWREFLSHSTEGKESEILKEYSLQVAYTFFVKVFILRVLEDKGLMGRILSDGGFSLWKKLIEKLSLIGSNGEMRFNLLFALAIKHVREKVFSDIEKNRVYDWYSPDDMLFLKLLELMNKYSFRNVKQDIIGYIYEKLMEKVHRHELGIYLTPPEIVDYMLDKIGYRGREVIGRKFIDPACGSGTFLVHAVRRYREALKEAGVENLEEKFIRDVQENFRGVDINSFSVYLAGINLFVQILDDVRKSIESDKEIPLISFNLQVGNTFRLFRELKKERFHYVVSNPPYVNAKKAGFSPPSELLEEFSDRLRGDINTYTLFLCIASEILHEGGRLAYIVPLTLLGDQQTERLRRFFSERGTVLHLTKFHRRTNVLFEGVTQAVVVFVWEKGRLPDTLPTVSWGGVLAKTREEIVREALANTMPVESITYRIEKPSSGSQEDMFGNGDYTVWVVLSGTLPQHTKNLFKALDTIVSHKKALRDLLQESGIDPERNFKQGDVNTTLVAPYHASKDAPRAMPIYKGEDLRPFSPLPEEPVGIKGRDGNYRPPYVAPREEDHTGINRTLWQIYESEEWLAVINRIVINLNHPRNIRGSITYRDRFIKKIFTDKVWILRCQDRETSVKIASLMFSLPFVFQYNALNTNTQINKNTLLLLKVPPDIPDRVIDHYNNLERISEEFRGLGIEDITEHLNPLWYELKENLSFEKLVSWEVLLSGIPAVTLENFCIRYANKRRQPRGTKINSYLREEYWDFHVKEAESVIQLFREKKGEERYEAIKDEPLLPDNPVVFNRRLDDLKKRFNVLLCKWKDNLKAIDTAILESYRLAVQPEELVMPLII